jgi:hypothetical protein
MVLTEGQANRAFEHFLEQQPGTIGIDRLPQIEELQAVGKR